MKLLIFGAGGQVGSALRKLHPEGIFLDTGDADFTKPQTLGEVLEKHTFDAIINAAAYTQVDNAELEEDIAQAVNADAPAYIAAYCAAKRIPFVHYSTDYVFDGSGSRAWKEMDKTAPLSAYGRTKLAGEEAIRRAGGNYLIFRTSWVYDATGRNFFNTMLRHGADREEMKVVNDQFGAPTYAAHLAAATLLALESAVKIDPFPAGIYHLCNAGVVSWHGFAQKIFDGAREHGAKLKVVSLKAIGSHEYPTRAVRPRNSRLDMSRVQKVFDIHMPDWKEGLAECLEEKFPA
jgi:dTDP-4-dehydrorhamnose reductase